MYMYMHTHNYAHIRAQVYVSMQYTRMQSCLHVRKQYTYTCMHAVQSTHTYM